MVTRILYLLLLAKIFYRKDHDLRRTRADTANRRNGRASTSDTSGSQPRRCASALSHVRGDRRRRRRALTRAETLATLVGVNELDRFRRMATKGQKRLSDSGGRFFKIVEQAAAQQAVSRLREETLRWDAEKAAAPLVTRNAVLALNERMDSLLDVTKELAEASLAQSKEATEHTRQASRVVWLSFAVLLVALATLAVTLVR